MSLGNISNLGLYGINNSYLQNLQGLQNVSLYNDNNFDLLLSSGALSGNQNILGSLGPGSGLSPALGAILSKGASSFTNKFLDKLMPMSSMDASNSNTTLYGSGYGASNLELLGSMFINTIPYIKTRGTWGGLFQSLPQIFQMVASGKGTMNFFREARQLPQSQPMKISDSTYNDLSSELAYESSLSEFM